MIRMIKFMLFLPRLLFMLPAIVVLKLSKNKSVMKIDVKRWGKETLDKVICSDRELIWTFCYLFIYQREFRSLVYYRLPATGILRPFFRPISELYIVTKNIGCGLYIQHGFGTIIHARSVGEYCWINQQVTIGFSAPGSQPTIGNNVTIGTGAKVLGNVVIGDNVIIGANAVVVSDIPDDCTVAGVPAKIIRHKGIRVGTPGSSL